MTLQVHLQMAGALLVTLGLAHAGFGRYFGWEQELQKISLLPRQVFWVHTFFIALLLVMLGLGSLLGAAAMLTPGPLSRGILGAQAIFWLCRLCVQWFVYDSSIWRGRRFYTVMHVVFSALWIYLAGAYAAAFVSVTL